MFFHAEREHFFRPLTGKHREVIVACLKALYQRLYSPEADYAYHLTREDLRDLFLEMVRETPLLSQEFSDEDSDYFRSAKDEAAKANEILRLLTDSGWMEKYVDKGTMVSVYRFTKAGKSFSEALFRIDFKGFKTRQRNVRNTKNSLEAFLRDGDPYDLIDAVDYSQQVVSDLSDDISDLHERKRQLMKTAVKKISIAVEDFLRYMDQEFVPDLAIRLSADSIERHRHRIREISHKIQDWSDRRLATADSKLCQMTGREVDPENPLILHLLNMIRNSVESACQLKSPELRAALDSFVNRADLIIKQATALSVGLSESPVAISIDTLAKLSAQDQDKYLIEAAKVLGTSRIRLVDPRHVHMRKTIQRRDIETYVTEDEATGDERLQAVVRDALDMAFAVSMDNVRSEVKKQMGKKKELPTSHILVKDVPSLLALSHALELAALGAQEEDEGFTIEPTGKRFHTPYLDGEEFIIRKTTK